VSLNWKEIDLLLSELDLAGAKIERLLQPGFDSLVIGLYKDGRETDLLLSIAQGACRVHALTSRPPKPERPLRFQECLKSRLSGARVEAVTQLGTERILRFDISADRTEDAGSGSTVYKAIGIGARKTKSRRETGSVLRHYRLYARLWSGAGNVLLVDEDGTIVDVMARRPKRGELSGEACRIEEDLNEASAGPVRSGPPKIFTVRDLPALEGRPGGGSFNERIEALYAAQGGALSREALLEAARDRFAKRSAALESKIAELEARAAEFRDSERLRELGDILMANQGLAYEGKYLACEDFYRGGQIRIPVDPRLSIVDNARTFYERHRKAKSGLADVELELSGVRGSLERLRVELDGLEREADPFRLARALAKGGASRPKESGAPRKRTYPGLSLERSGWTILIGRNAKENDELLRHHVRGSDLWLHARDWPGSYVFVKGRKDKSVPLEILLDAGTLAIYYSKGRQNGEGDLYYTLAKHLRRAKDGPKGTVLPSHEKNLAIKIDENRLKELRSLIGEET
jgi:predicted ribosome quality control (RQC) complex YloA/Tae2 family protein